MKKKLTKGEYLNLIGLLTLAKSGVRRLGDIEEEVSIILGEEGRWGHAGDLVWSSDDGDIANRVNEFIRNQEIEVPKL